MGQNESMSGMSWIYVLFVIIVIWAVFGGFGGMQRSGGSSGGGSGGGTEAMTGTYAGWQSEKQALIDSAKTQYMVEQQAAGTRAEMQAGFNAIMEQNRAIYEQGMQETIFDLKMENSSLKNSIAMSDGFRAISDKINAAEVRAAEVDCALNRRLDGIECRMLTKPALTGVAATACGTIIPSGCGCNGFGFGTALA